MGKQQKAAKEAEKEVQKVELELCVTKGVRTYITEPFLQREQSFAFEKVLTSCWINSCQNLISNKLIRVKLQEDVRRRNREEIFANICAISIKMLPKQ